MDSADPRTESISGGFQPDRTDFPSRSAVGKGGGRAVWSLAWLYLPFLTPPPIYAPRDLRLDCFNKGRNEISDWAIISLLSSPITRFPRSRKWNVLGVLADLSRKLRSTYDTVFRKVFPLTGIWEPRGELLAVRFRSFEILYRAPGSITRIVLNCFSLGLAQTRRVYLDSAMVFEGSCLLLETWKTSALAYGWNSSCGVCFSRRSN